MGEVEAEFADFSRLLRLLLSQYSVGTIPASLDRVTAGDAQRLGGRACKVLFLLGAEDGAIPQVAPGQGLLTDQDRLLLEDNYFDMQPGTRKIRVLSGNTEGLKIRSVYDIR